MAVYSLLMFFLENPVSELILKIRMFACRVVAKGKMHKNDSL